jgi:His-Xaa-Ser system protein HxsD
MNKVTEKPDISAPSLHFAEGAVRVLLNADAYQLTAVQKTSYTFADQCTALIGSVKDGVLPLSLVFRANTTEEYAIAVARRFLDDLLDQELREKIGEETRAIRSLILAHAFSRTNLIRRD